ncbi:TetR/AcrR family transcriptional regulator [Thermoactinospora rubra]|uniref:TetR/AcrR family transcriptional regulator n=1 Tax=Thermoactinospora rubra TaxID=1088767 RepID=UPI000A0F43C1|nr:helix-turn-helix domain-containing protein [Thermoactinospora rubra]
MRRTRAAIQRALVELILEKGYDAVTVTELIDRADVGRSTFYAHFADKREVLYGFMEEQLAFLLPAPATGGPLFPYSRRMFEHAWEQRRLLRALLGRRGGVVHTRGEQMFATVVREELVARGLRSSVDVVVACVVGAFMTLVGKWLDGEIRGTPAELDAAFRAAVTPGVEHMIATCADGRDRRDRRS